MKNVKTMSGIALSALAGLAACAGGRATAPSANAPAPEADLGVLVMAHGGTPEWNDAVTKTIEPLRAKYPIEIAFGMADATTIQDAVTRLEARHVHRIAVVRLFVSGESWQERTEQILGVRAGAPPASASGEEGHDGHAMHDGHVMHGEHTMHDAHAMAGMPSGHSMAFFRIATNSSFALTTDGLVDAPGMGKVLADRATALSKDPAREDVLILAHGPGDDAENARWLAKLDERAAAIRAATPFRRVQVETLREDWPDKRAAAEERIRAFVKRATDEGGTTIVVPFRVQGFGPYKQVLDGLTYVSDGQGLIPHAEVRAWIEQEIEALRTRSFQPTVAH